MINIDELSGPAILAAIRKQRRLANATDPLPLFLPFGVRSPERTAGIFDDVLGAVYQVPDTDDGRYPDRTRFKLFAGAGTTDPTQRYLTNPENVAGTAILVPGHYPDLWRIGRHRDRYAALVQVGTSAARVWRDADRDVVLDLDGQIHPGWYGINNHSAALNPFDDNAPEYGLGDSMPSGASAGCQVWASAGQYRAWWRLVVQYEADVFGHYSYTLLDFDEALYG